MNDPENPLRSLDDSVVAEDIWQVRRQRNVRLASYLVVIIIVGLAVWSLVTST